MERQSIWLHRFSLLVAAAALILIASGAFVTSSREASSATISGTEVHQMLGIGVTALVLILTIWTYAAARATGARVLAGAAAILGAMQAFVGLQQPLSPGAAALHASLTPLLFGCLAGVVFLTSPDWNFPPEPVDDRGMRFLRPLAASAPPLVVLQIALGALYRHKLTSVMWHMAGAMLVALVTLVASMVVLQQCPSHRQLRGSAIHLMSIVLLQVTLGVAAFTMQLLETENTVALAIVTGSHVVVGNLTLTASLLFAIQVWRTLQRAAFTPV